MQMEDTCLYLFKALSMIINNLSDLAFCVKRPLVVFNFFFHSDIIVVLSNQRTKGRFERSWRLIYILGQILNKILQISEHEKNYEDVKHCIILSQTFFCSEKKTKNKYFLFEYIKNNKWLKSPKFWDEMTDYMIEKEIESNNKILGQEALDKETLEGKRERYSQVCISQLLTFSENMIDFGFI